MVFAGDFFGEHAILLANADAGGVRRVRTALCDRDSFSGGEAGFVDLLCLSNDDVAGGCSPPVCPPPLCSQANLRAAVTLESYVQFMSSLVIRGPWLKIRPGGALCPDQARPTAIQAAGDGGACA